MHVSNCYSTRYALRLIFWIDPHIRFGAVTTNPSAFSVRFPPHFVCTRRYQEDAATALPQALLAGERHRHVRDDKGYVPTAITEDTDHSPSWESDEESKSVLVGGG